MKVVCNGCGAEYNVDPSKIKGTKAWFKCKSCSENIIVEKKDILDTFDSVENPTVEDLLGGDANEALEENKTTDQSAQAPPDLAGKIGTDDSDSDTGLPPETESKEALGQSTPAVPQKKYFFGLTTKVVFLMLIVSMVPGGIFFGISSKHSHDRIVAETSRTGTMISHQLAGKVDEWIDKNVRALRTAAQLSDIQLMDAFYQEDILKAIQREYPWIYLVFTTDMQGMNIARSDGKPLKDYGDRQYVKDIVDGSKLAWQNLIGKTSKQPALVLAVPIIKEGRYIGVIAAAMTRKDISKGVTQFKLGKTGSGFLVDKNDKIVAHQNNAFVLKQRNMVTHPLIQSAKTGRQTNIEFVDADGKTAIGFTARTAIGWILAVQQDKDEAMAPLKQAQKSAVLLLGITLAAVFVIALLASRFLVKPIKELTDAANRISVGDMDVEINTQSKNEIGDLADAIIRLQDSIQISISRLQRLKK